MARLSARVREYAREAIPPEDRPYEEDPPEDVHFKCGSCDRRGRTRRAALFSYTPLQLKSAGPGEVLEGRCLECAVHFRGRLLEYGFGRRILWAKFRRKVVEHVMES